MTKSSLGIFDITREKLLWWLGEIAA